MTSIEQHDRDINQLITNVKELDALHGSWGADKASNFSVLNADHYGVYSVTTTTGATVVATLPAAATANKHRAVTISKADATTGEVQIAVSGGGLLNGKWAALYLINQGDSLTVISNGALWLT
jgi:hypothetical protein